MLSTNTLINTNLSVNINKIATLRNSRGGNVPNLIQVAQDCERFGADGITVHPRPDERHIRYSDVIELKKIVKTEFNIEGRPDKKFLDLVLEVRPTQCTLVPDEADALTSNAGWNTIQHAGLLKEVIQELHKNGIRTSIFVDPIPSMIEGAREAGSDRIELYTETYARDFETTNIEELAKKILPFVESATLAHSLGLGINAGHDLNLKNLAFFKKTIPYLQEVSIGHALIADALYLGLENTIRLYIYQLR